MLSCDQFLAELGNYVDGQVEAEIRRHLEFHLSECRTCQVIYDSTRKTLKILTESGSFDLTEGISESIVGRIMEKIRAGGSNGQRT